MLSSTTGSEYSSSTGLEQSIIAEAGSETAEAVSKSPDISTAATLPTPDTQDTAAVEEVELVIQPRLFSSARTDDCLDGAISNAIAVEPLQSLLHSASSAAAEENAAITVLPQLRDQLQPEASHTLAEASYTPAEASHTHAETGSMHQEVSAEIPGDRIAEGPAEEADSTPADVEDISLLLPTGQPTDTSLEAGETPRRSLLQKLRHKASYGSADSASAAVPAAALSSKSEAVPENPGKQKKKSFMGLLRHGSSIKSDQIPATIDRAESNPDTLSSHSPVVADVAASDDAAARAGLIPAALGRHESRGPSSIVEHIAPAQDPADSDDLTSKEELLELPADTQPLPDSITVLSSMQAESPSASPRKKSLFSRLRPTHTPLPKPEGGQSDRLSQQSSELEPSPASPRQKGFKSLFKHGSKLPQEASPLSRASSNVSLGPQQLADGGNSGAEVLSNESLVVESPVTSPRQKGFKSLFRSEHYMLQLKVDGTTYTSLDRWFDVPPLLIDWHIRRVHLGGRIMLTGLWNALGARTPTAA